MIYELKNFLRLDESIFYFILNSLAGKLTKKSIRTPIPADLRLLITFRFLATGDSFRSLSFLFGVSHNCISNIVRECLTEIVRFFGPKYQLTQKTETEWRKVEKGFRAKFNFKINESSNEFALRCFSSYAIHRVKIIYQHLKSR